MSLDKNDGSMKEDGDAESTKESPAAETVKTLRPKPEILDCYREALFKLFHDLRASLECQTLNSRPGPRVRTRSPKPSQEAS